MVEEVRALGPLHWPGHITGDGQKAFLEQETVKEAVA
jgi:hypothetical protein